MNQKSKQSEYLLLSESIRSLRLLQLSGTTSYFSKRLKKTFDLIINDEEAFPRLQRNLLLIRFGESVQIDQNIVEALKNFRKQKGKLSIPVLKKLKELFRKDDGVKEVAMIYEIILEMLQQLKKNNLDDDYDESTPLL